MPYDPQRHHRRSIRLPGYDYTQPGAYFITIVTHERMLSFGEIVDGEMRLNEYGQIVRAEWFQTAVVRPYVVLHPDEFVVMPNYVHGIVWIVDMGGMDDDVGRGAAPLRPYQPSTQPTRRWRRHTHQCHPRFVRRHRAVVQIRHRQTHQRPAGHARRARLATQLLRTYHPHRPCPGPHSRLHPIQPPTLGR